MEGMRKFLQDELKKASGTLQKYEEALINPSADADKEFLKSSIEYYRAQCSELRKQIFETKGELK
jgi:hypothetical protein